MTTRFRVMPHGIRPGVDIVEVWHGEKFIGQLVGLEGPGLRFTSRLEVVVLDGMAASLLVMAEGGAVTPLRFNTVELRVVE